MNLTSFQTMRDSANALDAAWLLLRDLIDYAGLFPPASLSMARCVADYEAYSRSEWNWVLGRFIVPVARLDEFEEALAGLEPLTPEIEAARWRLSVLLKADVAEDVARIRLFNDRMVNCKSCRKAIIESVEVRIASAAEVTRLSTIIPSEIQAYFEFLPASPVEFFTAVSGCGRRAKIRTGGETSDKFPPSESVIEFIRLCAACNVPFKATAGLHHPIRSMHRFTYHPESPSGLMHGFLNVFLAAAFLRAGMDSNLATQLLEEQSPHAFQFDLSGVRWREHWLSRNEIAAARENSAVSFGSCSFIEPIDDLRSLHLL